MTTATLLLWATIGVGEVKATFTLGIAGGYTEFIFGDATQSNTDSTGPVAVGGNATFTDFSVADSSLSGTGATLVVGGNLNWTRGTLFHGTGVVGDTIATTGVGNGGNIAKAAPPFSFADVKADLQSLSSSLSAYQGAVNASGTTLGDVNSSGLQVFNVSASSLGSYTLQGALSSTVIVNVIGGSAAVWQNGEVKLAGGLTSSHVLWNFVDATSLNISSIGVNGTVLAVNANVVFNNGQLNGSLIAKSLTGSSGETHVNQGGNGNVDTRFTGEIPVTAVPEPSDLAMLASATLSSLVLAVRRRAAR